MARCDVAAERMKVRDPVRQARQHLGFLGLCLFPAFGDVLDVRAPPAGLEPVVRETDLRAGKARALGRVGLNSQQQVFGHYPRVQDVPDPTETLSLPA